MFEVFIYTNNFCLHCNLLFNNYMYCFSITHLIFLGLNNINFENIKPSRVCQANYPCIGHSKRFVYKYIYI